MYRKIFAFVAVVASIALVSATPALANGTDGKHDQLYTKSPCFQHFDVYWDGRLYFSGNGQGYGKIAWGTITGVPEWYYDFNHPSASSYYPSNFLGQWDEVTKNGGTWVDEDPNGGRRSQFDTRRGSQEEYPEANENFRLDTTHDWGAAESCGIYWYTSTQEHEAIPPYDPHSEPGAVQPLFATGEATAIPLYSLTQLAGAPGATEVTLTSLPTAQDLSVVDITHGVSTGYKP